MPQVLTAAAAAERTSQMCVVGQVPDYRRHLVGTSGADSLLAPSAGSSRRVEASSNSLSFSQGGSLKTAVPSKPLPFPGSGGSLNVESFRLGSSSSYGSLQIGSQGSAMPPPQVASAGSGSSLTVEPLRLGGESTQFTRPHSNSSSVSSNSSQLGPQGSARPSQSSSVVSNGSSLNLEPLRLTNSCSVLPRSTSLNAPSGSAMPSKLVPFISNSGSLTIEPTRLEDAFAKVPHSDPPNSSQIGTSGIAMPSKQVQSIGNTGSLTIEPTRLEDSFAMVPHSNSLGSPKIGPPKAVMPPKPSSTSDSTPRPIEPIRLQKSPPMQLRGTADDVSQGPPAMLLPTTKPPSNSDSGSLIGPPAMLVKRMTSTGTGGSSLTTDPIRIDESLSMKPRSHSDGDSQIGVPGTGSSVTADPIRLEDSPYMKPRSISDTGPDESVLVTARTLQQYRQNLRKSDEAEAASLIASSASNPSASPVTGNRRLPNVTPRASPDMAAPSSSRGVPQHVAAAAAVNSPKAGTSRRSFGQIKPVLTRQGSSQGNLATAPHAAAKGSETDRRMAQAVANDVPGSWRVSSPAVSARQSSPRGGRDVSPRGGRDVSPRHGRSRTSKEELPADAPRSPRSRSPTAQTRTGSPGRPANRSNSPTQRTFTHGRSNSRASSQERAVATAKGRIDRSSRPSSRAATPLASARSTPLASARSTPLASARAVAGGGSTTARTLTENLARTGQRKSPGPAAMAKRMGTAPVRQRSTARQSSARGSGGKHPLEDLQVDGPVLIKTVPEIGAPPPRMNLGGCSDVANLSEVMETVSVNSTQYAASSGNQGGCSSQDPASDTMSVDSGRMLAAVVAHYPHPPGLDSARSQHEFFGLEMTGGYEITNHKGVPAPTDERLSSQDPWLVAQQTAATYAQTRTIGAVTADLDAIEAQLRRVEDERLDMLLRSAADALAMEADSSSQGTSCEQSGRQSEHPASLDEKWAHMLKVIDEGISNVEDAMASDMQWHDSRVQSQRRNSDSECLSLQASRSTLLPEIDTLSLQSSRSHLTQSTRGPSRQAEVGCGLLLAALNLGSHFQLPESGESGHVSADCLEPR